MHVHRRWCFAVSLLIAATVAVSAAAQQPPAPAAHAKPAVKRAARRAVRPNHAAGETARSEAAKPTLLGQYGEWGAYTASPGGKKICFAIAKPVASKTNPPDRPRDPPYLFITTRPADKVTNEVSIIIGYPFRPNSEATAEVGATTFALYTEKDGAWIKNAEEEAHMVELMRAGDTAVVKGVSSRGTHTTDTFSLKGLSQALDRVAAECK
jgi:Invasion associated locus B (IalB) protein